MSETYKVELTLNQEGAHKEGDLAIEYAKPELSPPPMYKVVLYNDDYTPMDFVVQVLEMFFNMNSERANQVMLMVHEQGKAVCGIYSRDIAETKVAQVNQFSTNSDHPLLCGIDIVN